MQANFKYRDSSGNAKDGYMALEDYRFAAQNGMSAAAVVNARHRDADPAYGSAFAQGCKYLGIHVKGDASQGIRPSTLRSIETGDCIEQYAGAQLAGGLIVSPKAPIGGSTPASRIFFPEVVTQLASEALQADYGMEESAWNQMFATTTSINSEVWTQPLIDTRAPQAQDMRPIGQNQLPANMVSITASQTSQALGAISIGLQVSDQATRDVTVDLVGLIVQEQALGARMRNLWRHLNQLVIGNPDMRNNTLANSASALTPVVFKTTYDTTVADDSISNRGWLKAMWDPTRIFNMNFVLGDFDAYLAIQNRTGRPLAYDPATSVPNVGNAGQYGLDAGTPELINFGTSKPRMLLVPDGVIPAKQLLLFDSKYAIHRVINVAANYAATEANIMSRSQSWRWDMSEVFFRFRDAAFLLIDYAKP